MSDGTTHRRRSPCCVDEARRYLAAEGFDVVDEHGREVILEPARARIAELEARPVCEHLLGLPA